MKYISTRGAIEPIGFQDALMMGLADDGGLLIPQSIPDLAGRLEEFRTGNFAGWQSWQGRWGQASAGGIFEDPHYYACLALEILKPFADDLPEDDLRQLVQKTYCGGAFVPHPAPTVPVGPVHVLELWHGPTLAFKDLALQLLGNLFEYVLARRGGRLNILGATSGDTGSAAIYGVRGRRGIHIFMMHPHNRTSPIQARQMTTVLDENVHNIALEGSFDDCQAIMKTLAGELEFKRRYSIGAVNSVNWARVLAQIVYYFHSSLALCTSSKASKVDFAVPTGNFGDVLAGWYAMKMGAPIRKLILATNENDILSRFFNTGVYSILGNVHQTLSPSMDIQVASNFERYLYYRLGCDAAKLRDTMAQFGRSGSLNVQVAPGAAVDDAIAAGSADTQEALSTIAQFHKKYNYVLDPHTAVGVAVAMKHAATAPDGSVPVICLATAHPAKFPVAIRKATGQDLAHHQAIDGLMTLPTRCQMMPNDAAAVKEFIVKTLD